ncbi:MAG: LamB/YcsF family protein [Burkholderiales bacterium]
MRDGVDLNTQLAEGFVLPPFGVPLEDMRGLKITATGAGFHARHQVEKREDVLPFVTSASLACGLHSGDPVLLAQVARDAIARGVQVGAHPSYPGVFSYGQQRIDLSDGALEAVLLFQLGAAAAVIAGAGGRMRHIKCHGPLAMDISYDTRFGRVMLEAVRKFDPGLLVIFAADSPGLDAARRAGLRAAGEGYADRGYGADGRPVPRDHPRALIEDASAVALRMRDILCEGRVTCVDGTRIALHAESVFLHSDTPGAATLAAAAVAAAREAGVALRPSAGMPDSAVD